MSFCGVSLGGMVGMALALHAPERVERLVLSCTSAYIGPPDGVARARAVVRADGMNAIADAVVGRWFTPALPRTSRETVARFRAMLGVDAAGGVRALLRGDRRLGRPRRGSPRSRRPCSSSRARMIRRPRSSTPSSSPSRIPGARLRVLERAAHLANVERAEAFTEAVLEHLGQEVPA